jgi:hypothetical protein
MEGTGKKTHVANMICTVEVDSIPAGREECLCSNSEARLRGQAVGVGSVTCS